MRSRLMALAGGNGGIRAASLDVGANCGICTLAPPLVPDFIEIAVQGFADLVPRGATLMLRKFQLRLVPEADL